MSEKSRAKVSRTTTFLRLAYSAPERSDPTAVPAGTRRFILPATKSLPFVKLRAHDQPMWLPESFWHVEPTGKRETDVRRGRKYARIAVAAMRADQNDQLIAHIVQDIIRDVVQNGKKRRHGRRNAVVLGFLSEISEAVGNLSRSNWRASDDA